ncbi:MAG: class I SAM-dependent methyltransferase [Treponema sp.]|nr:class I SAM-dependent methyltransferase [Treponema sp.]
MNESELTIPVEQITTYAWVLGLMKKVVEWLMLKCCRCNNCNSRGKDIVCRRTLKKKINQVKEYNIFENTFILRDVTLRKYSEFGNMIANGDNIEKIITVFAIHPADLFREVAKKLLEQQKGNKKIKDDKVSLDSLNNDKNLLTYIKGNKIEFWNELNYSFKHFAYFEKIKREKNKNVTRYLINLEEKRLEQQDLAYLDLFSKLGLGKEQFERDEKSKIDCYIIDKKRLIQDNCLLSDHVVYQCKNGQLLTMYNTESKSLTVAYEKADSSFPYETISKHHEDEGNREFYKTIFDFINEHRHEKQSHLYKEYCYVSKLSSIKKQWELQADIIAKVNPDNLLIVGVGFGDEIDVLIDKFQFKYRPTNSLGKLKIIGWADLDDKYVGASLEVKKKKFSNLVAIDQAGTDLLEIKDVNKWDCILCSFVLHDIEYEDKEKAIKILHEALKPDGIVIISEMFLDNKIKSGYTTKNLERKRKIDDLYGEFCKEIEKIKITDIIVHDKKKFLEEVLKTKEDARNGERDYFLTEKQTIEFLSKAGFDANLDDGDIKVNNEDIKRYIENEINPYLGILTARKRK